MDILAMGRAAAFAAPLLPLAKSGAHTVWFSYGEVIPELSSGFLFYGAGRWAASLRKSVPNRFFMAPGSDWLSGLPIEFTGRHVITEKYQEALEHIDAVSVFFKLAEAKHDLLPAGSYTVAQLRTVLSQAPELADADVQWTTATLLLNNEHRFFILDGQVLTGSPYLIDGEVYSANMSWGLYPEALAHAQRFSRELKDAAPPAYVLDVAQNMVTGEWLIVEANRSWSSGLYGSTPELALWSIEASLQPSTWEWRPDPAVDLYSEMLVTLPPTAEHRPLMRLGQL